MRNILLTICGAMTFFSCHKEESIIPEIPTWNDIHLTWSRALLPDAYYSNISKAVFVNSAGDEKKLNLWIDTTSQAVMRDTNHYTQDRFSILYSDPNLPEFYIGVNAKIEYLSTGLKTFESLIIAFYPPSLESYTPVIIFEGPDSIVVGGFLPQKTISGLNFENVYAFTPLEVTDNSYDEIYFVGGSGIVGFQGENGELWGLIKYE